MSYKEQLIEFVKNLSNEEADLILSHLKDEEEKRCKPNPAKYHKFVYLIKHNATGKGYIGSTKNLDQRISRHLSALRGGRHIVKDMQADFDKYGDGYTVSILEEITDPEKRHREYELITSHKTYIREKGYNYNDRIYKVWKGEIKSYEGKRKRKE